MFGCRLASVPRTAGAWLLPERCNLLAQRGRCSLDDLDACPWQGVHARGSGSVEVLLVTGQAAVGFVVMASAMLLLLFFFLNSVFSIVLVRHTPLHTYERPCLALSLPAS